MESIFAETGCRIYVTSTNDRKNPQTVSNAGYDGSHRSCKAPCSVISLSPRPQAVASMYEHDVSMNQYVAERRHRFIEQDLSN